MKLTAPFAYFGNKARIAPEVWSLLGDVQVYIEPFCGACGVLLGRPANHRGSLEVVNDCSGLLVNMWRAMRHSPRETAFFAFGMNSEIDYHAIYSYFNTFDYASFVQRLETEPEFCDPKMAGWYIQLNTLQIGNGGLREYAGGLMAINAISGKGGGVFRMSFEDREAAIRDWFVRLSRRLQNVRVCYGDWSRVLTRNLLAADCGVGTCGILFDPPYEQGQEVYGKFTMGKNLTGEAISVQVRNWIKASYAPNQKIILCGYRDDHDDLLDIGFWRKEWKPYKGYSKKQCFDTHKEVLWCSPSLKEASIW
jgi:site-specific DNA-adenine methylase